jgi:hypothetical protein
MAGSAHDGTASAMALLSCQKNELTANTSAAEVILVASSTTMLAKPVALGTPRCSAQSTRVMTCSDAEDVAHELRTGVGAARRRHRAGCPCAGMPRQMKPYETSGATGGESRQQTHCTAMA